MGARFRKQLLHGRNRIKTARTFAAVLIHKSSINSAVVFGSTVTALSSGAGGAFVLAHSSTILVAWAGNMTVIKAVAAAVRARFIKILTVRLVRLQTG